MMVGRSVRITHSPVFFALMLACIMDVSSSNGHFSSTIKVQSLIRKRLNSRMAWEGGPSRRAKPGSYFSP